MKRLFPRAVPEALFAILLVGAGCSPSANVKPGAPVLHTLSLIEPSGNKLDITADTGVCDQNAAEGKDCDPGTSVCFLANVLCQCVAKDMCDPSINADAAVTGGTLNCAFAPESTVRAVFDRLLDPTPFEPKTPASIATLTATPATTATTAGDYTSTGSTTGLIFAPGFFGTPNGPYLTVSGAPALPVDSTVTIALDKSTVRAKDGKTGFAGTGALADGTVTFKTSGFAASITVPAPPPPMDMGGSSAPMCPGAVTPPDAGDGGTAEDAGASDGGADAGAPADASDAAPPAPPSTDVPADMNKGAITVSFTNPVGKDVLPLITMKTEDGQPFTNFVAPAPTDFPMSSVSITPKTTWAPGKTYTITVDPAVVDVLGAKLGGTGAAASFTMSAN